MHTEFPDWSAHLNTVARTAAITGVVNIVITVLCIWLAWWALQTFRFDVFMRDPKGARAKMLMVLISIVLGHAVARFVIDYLQWSMLLGNLVR